MTNEPSIWGEIWRSVAANTTLAAAAWGAAGGATSALVIKVTTRDAAIIEALLTRIRGGRLPGG